MIEKEEDERYMVCWCAMGEAPNEQEQVVYPAYTLCHMKEGDICGEVFCRYPRQMLFF